MPQTFNNTTSDESIYPPEKRTINSFVYDKEFKCLSPFGAVSNINCPADDPGCNCPAAVRQLEPEEAEPTTEELVVLKNNTSECDKISEIFQNPEWLGIDFSNPNSAYNCNYCETVASGLSLQYQDVPGVSLNWNSNIKLTTDIGTVYAFNYDKRKTYDGYAYPDRIDITQSDPSDGCGKIIGDKFKYYKEYSKTSATFWNTPPKTPLYRQAQTALMTAQRVKILVNGDLRAKPGKMIFIDYPNFGGRWLIYKVERIVTPQKHSMYLHLMRDGVA
jgi:hypothetical protein